jgi:hypothetical protein
MRIKEQMCHCRERKVIEEALKEALHLIIPAESRDLIMLYKGVSDLLDVIGGGEHDDLGALDDEEAEVAFPSRQEGLGLVL